MESFILEQEFDSEAANAQQFLLSQENIEGADVRTVDPETQARLEALLEAAGMPYHIISISNKGGFICKSVDMKVVY